MEDSSPSRENLSWTGAQMDYLVQLLLEQSRVPGMKSDGGLKAKAYTRIEMNMIDCFGKEFTKDKLKNKLKYVKPNLTIMKEILNTSGFGYDPINKCIDVDPEVWSVYIEKYPNRKKYKGLKLWRYYEEFTEVYGDSRATGNDADTCSSMHVDEDIDPFTTTPFSHMQSETSQSFTEMLNEEISPVHSPVPLSPTAHDPRSTTNRLSSRCKRSRLTNDDEYLNLLNGIAEDVKNITSTSRAAQIQSCCSILEEMVAIGEIESEDELKCLDILAEGSNSLFFVNLHTSLRVSWLRNKLAGC